MNKAKVANFILDHGWEIYLVLILGYYGHSAMESSFWFIYIPTMILVAIAKAKKKLEDENEND